MKVYNVEGFHIADIESVVVVSALGAMCRWRVAWTGYYDMTEPTSTWGTLNQAQQCVEGVVERQERLAALERL